MALPTTPTGPTRQSPKNLIIYGAPKVGKTTLLSQLEGCVIADLEDGSNFVTALKVNIKNQDELSAFCDEVRQKWLVDKKPPYLYGALDTATKLEYWMEQQATADYRNSTLGKRFEGNSVLELPEGGGYLWLRNAFQRYLNKFYSAFPRTILVAHVREKLISSGDRAADAAGEKRFQVKTDGLVSTNDLDLTGKIRNITCADVDAICYVFRTAEKKVIASFANNGSVNSGSRPKHLDGAVFEFDWKKIYLD